MQIRVGTRGSKLALAQCDSVIEMLQEKFPSRSFEKVIIHTKGDLSTQPLTHIGGNGLFVREIEQQLSDGRIDLAVHSMKNPFDCTLGAVFLLCHLPSSAICTFLRLGSFAQAVPADCSACRLGRTL